jgi:hypothetical protein
VLDTVEVATDLFGGMDAVVEVGDEAGNGPLEVDVVLPQRVVRVDQQSLVGHTTAGKWLVWGGLIWGSHTLIIRWLPVGIVTNVWGHATLGGYVTPVGCDRFDGMTNTDVARLDGPSSGRTPHDWRAAADVGYRVWNPFEAELRTEAVGRYEEVAKAFKRVIDVFER